jgi:hypothetical protein
VQGSNPVEPHPFSLSEWTAAKLEREPGKLTYLHVLDKEEARRPGSCHPRTKTGRTGSLSEFCWAQGSDRFRLRQPTFTATTTNTEGKGLQPSIDSRGPQSLALRLRQSIKTSSPTDPVHDWPDFGQVSTKRTTLCRQACPTLSLIAPEVRPGRPGAALVLLPGAHSSGRTRSASNRSKLRSSFAGTQFGHLPWELMQSVKASRSRKCGDAALTGRAAREAAPHYSSVDRFRRGFSAIPILLTAGYLHFSWCKCPCFPC